MDLLTALKSAKDLFGFARDLRAAFQRKEVQPNEVADRLLQIQELALELQNALNDAYEERRQLQSELDGKDKLLRLVDDLEFVEDGSFYRRGSEKGVSIFYCPVCWGDDQKLIPLYKMSPGKFRCVKHKHIYCTEAL